MGRIPDSEVRRVKREALLINVAPSYGVELKRHGAAGDLAGRCPFHSPDDTPSFVVTPWKNLFHCFGCGAAGTVIDFVKKIEQVEFVPAVEILQARFTIPGAEVQLPAGPFRADTSDPLLLADVVEYYHETFKREPAAQAYMASRGLDDAEMLEHFKIGYANRTIGDLLPAKSRFRDDDLRGRLMKIGILRDNGREHFNGSVVIPIHDQQGQAGGMYGRKISRALRSGTALHLYLGPHRAVWNIEALKASSEIILCEAILDALTFWRAGFRNVISAYGVNGFTEHHLVAMTKYGTKKVLIAFDADAAGDTAAEKVAALLAPLGIECLRIEFPRCSDANQYAQNEARA